MPPKHLYCAQCGLEIHYIRVALQGQIIDCVEPHTCSGEIKLPEGISENTRKEIIPQKKPKPGNLDSLFNKFKFVNKLNNLKPKNLLDGEQTGDYRPTENQRKEIKTSIAPSSIREHLNLQGPTSSERPYLKNGEEGLIDEDMED